MGSEEGRMLPAAASLDDMDDNILSEILLRLPPQPSSLPRASAVSKRWHSLACNPAFCRRFRRHHRHNPALLGFFDPHEFLTFVPTLDAPNRVIPGRFSLLYEESDRYEACGSRHGLVLIFDYEYRHVLVWDPVTGSQRRLDIPAEFEKDTVISGEVLRDAGDDHFRLVLVVGDTEDTHGQVLARVYSEETNSWGDLVSMPLPPPTGDFISSQLGSDRHIDEPAVLVGDSLYWHLYGSCFSGILEFNLERQSLALIQVPVDIHTDCFCVIREEGGGLGFLSVSGFTAQLWKRKTDSDGVASWGLGRTIELDKLLSLDPKEHERILVGGYAEENNIVFLRTTIGLFMVQLQSLQFTFMEHTETTNIASYLPFECVYTGETRRKGPEEFDISEQYIGWPE